MQQTIFTTKILEEEKVKSPTGEQAGNYYKIAMEPLDQGYGHTMGNSLRRVLLGSIPGAAITKVKIDGVNHQFTTLEGMREDIVEFILNLKKVRLSLKDDDEATIKLSAKGKGEVKAGDIEVPANVEIANKDLVIANLATTKTKLDAEITVKSGSGYVMAKTEEEMSFGEIPVDALFSPITKVAYKVEATRVGRRIDYDKLVMDIWTDGTVDVIKVLNTAAKTLVSHFKQVYEPVVIEEEEPVEAPSIENENMNLTVEELGIPTRIANALRKGGYKTVKDLAEAEGSEVAKVKNLGEKSVTTVSDALKKFGVELKD
ncbi:DNA-directed RNA polymerase subunit alpha [Patescibacteria group bacterium]